VYETFNRVTRMIFLQSLERLSNMENEKWIRGRQVCLPRIHFIGGLFNAY